MTEATRRAVILLKERLETCQAAGAALAELHNALKGRLAGTAVGEATQRLELSLGAVAQLQKEQARFLAVVSKDDMAAVIGEEPAGNEREAIERLLVAVTAAEQKLKEELSSSAKLLDNSMDFIQFQLNVISQTAADDIYAPPGKGGVEPRREIKMFDADV